MGSMSEEEKIKNNVYEAADFPQKNILNRYGVYFKE